MSDPTNPVPTADELSDGERQSALFANLVMQQTNAALLFLGQVPHPETGKTELDLEGARLFIDTLAMLEARTNGNLSKQEEGMLKQSLTTLRMAYVECVNQQGAEAKPEPVQEAPASEASKPPTAPPEPAASETESKKKFSKKY